MESLRIWNLGWLPASQKLPQILLYGSFFLEKISGLVSWSLEDQTNPQMGEVGEYYFDPPFKVVGLELAADSLKTYLMEITVLIASGEELIVN